jgi:RNA polymerase sigma factor (sigma-70 family)
VPAIWTRSIGCGTGSSCVWLRRSPARSRRVTTLFRKVFAAAFRHRNAYRGEGPLEAWLWRAVVNEARKAKSRRALPAAQVEPLVPNRAVPDETGVRAWVAALPERQRLVVFLRYYADLDYRSIAEVLEIEVGTVSATLSSAHAALRSQLREVQG